jgi:pimeloyl-ACP methyl ester carboxylesterase
MKRRFETLLGFRWSEIEPLTRAAGLSIPLLVVHDQHDEEIAWEEGADLAQACPGAQLLSTDGLGHRRLLREPAVVARVTRFLADPCQAEPGQPMAEPANVA